MKTKIPFLVSVLGLALVAGLAIAASNPSAPAPAPVPAPAGPPDDFHARIAEKLGLSPDQQKTLADLRARQRSELQALGDNQDLAPDARRDQARTIMENYRGQMRAVLTPEQQQKMGEWRGHLRERAGRFTRDNRPGGRKDLRGPGRPPEHPLAIVAMGERIKDRIAERLQLTDEQRDKLEHLGRAFRAQQRAAAKQHRDEMRAVLTPEQQQKADAWQQHFQHGPDGGHPPFLSLGEEPSDLPDALAGDLPSSEDI